MTQPPHGLTAAPTNSTAAADPSPGRCPYEPLAQHQCLRALRCRPGPSGVMGAQQRRDEATEPASASTDRAAGGTRACARARDMYSTRVGSTHIPPSPRCARGSCRMPLRSVVARTAQPCMPGRSRATARARPGAASRRTTSPPPRTGTARCWRGAPAGAVSARGPHRRAPVTRRRSLRVTHHHACWAVGLAWPHV